MFYTVISSHLLQFQLPASVDDPNVDSLDLSLVTPDYSLAEAVWFLAVLAIAVLLPGHALRRQFHLTAGNLWHRWALTSVLGILWTSLLYFALAACHWQFCHLWLSPLPWLVHLVRTWRSWPGCLRRASSLKRLFQPSLRPILVGLILAAALSAGYFVRTAALVQNDANGLRLYGAFYSDKLTNMSPCAALRHDVPPAALRISGYAFPSHYFPHLFVAAFDVGAGIDYLDGFWFYVATFGVFVRSLAVLAFSRRMLHSPWLACLTLLVFGLARFSPQDKTLDLSFALLLLAIGSLDRYRCSRRRRWLILCVTLIAAMPFYEVFTAAAALGGLVIWAAVSLITSRDQTILRSTVAIAACVGAVLAVRMLYFGAELASPPELKFKNVYRESYKHEWRDRLREPDPPPWMAQLYAWKRGKTISDVADLPGDKEPGAIQRVAGEIAYNLGFVSYFILRWVNLGLFGMIALVMRCRQEKGDILLFRKASEEPSRQELPGALFSSRCTSCWNQATALIAAVVAVGFAVPCVLVWGHAADGQWWETPNIYRLTTCAWMLLVLLGMGTLVEACRQFQRPQWWLPLAIAAWQVWIVTTTYFERPTSFHHVPKARLETLAFLRTQVSHGEIVLHPWVHDLIRNHAQPDEVAWVYKRHFTLASNLAGCQMFYEGREDHLFINGFVTAEEVYRRRQLRDRFYQSPDEATVREIIEDGHVRWIVSDAESPAPEFAVASWQLQFESGGVRVYSR